MLARTPLYERHLAAGARLVEFAGWEMPVSYEGVGQEHRAVRADAGVFDVSHMGQIEIEGSGAHTFLQQLLSNDLGRVEEHGAQYTLLTNESGGIVDDLIAYRLTAARDLYLLVVNASNRAAVVDWLTTRAPIGCEIRDVSAAHALLAVQGPNALRRLGLVDAPAFTHARGVVAGIDAMVCRTGYTGERGVELLCAPDDAPALWDAIVDRGVVPCGLGARDTLRLEVCYPLHGNDIGPETDAISAGLGWVCALDVARGKDFTGAEALRRIKAAGPACRLVAFVMEEKAVPRQGMPVVGGGVVTSGTHSPLLDLGIGMAYVPSDAASPGTEIIVDVRGKERRARVVKKPIYQREEHT